MLERDATQARLLPHVWYCVCIGTDWTIYVHGYKSQQETDQEFVPVLKTLCDWKIASQETTRSAEDWFFWIKKEGKNTCKILNFVNSDPWWCTQSSNVGNLSCTFDTRKGIFLQDMWWRNAQPIARSHSFEDYQLISMVYQSIDILSIIIVYVNK